MVFFSDYVVASFFETAHGHLSAKFTPLDGGTKKSPPQGRTKKSARQFRVLFKILDPRSRTKIRISGQTLGEFLLSANGDASKIGNT
jgi:hypothetical protein